MQEHTDSASQHGLPVLNTAARITAAHESLEFGDQYAAGELISDLLIELSPFIGRTVVAHGGTALL